MNKFSHRSIRATDSSIVYFWLFGQLLNTPLEWIAYWRKYTVAMKSLIFVWHPGPYTILNTALVYAWLRLHKKQMWMTLQSISKCI